MNDWWWIQQHARNYQKTFHAFMQCMKTAEEGKTFVYMHPKFVAVDIKTWEKLQKKARPKPVIYFDEWGDLPIDWEPTIKPIIVKKPKK